MSFRKIFWTVFLFSTVTVVGNFGSDPKPNGSMMLEDRGLPGNLAFLMHYADAVVVAKKDKMMTAGNGMEVLEVVWSRKGIQIPERIYLVTRDVYYTDNSRIVVPTDKRLTEEDFTYGTMANYDFVPTLLFLRNGEMDEKWRKAWELEGRPLYKCVNGKEGVIPLPHLIAEADKNKSDRFWDMVGSRSVKEAGNIVGSTDSVVILSTLRSFYSSEITKFKDLNNAVTEKLKTDAVILLRSMALERRAPTNGIGPAIHEKH